MPDDDASRDWSDPAAKHRMIRTGSHHRKFSRRKDLLTTAFRKEHGPGDSDFGLLAL